MTECSYSVNLQFCQHFSLNRLYSYIPIYSINELGLTEPSESVENTHTFLLCVFQYLTTVDYFSHDKDEI